MEKREGSPSKPLGERPDGATPHQHQGWTHGFAPHSQFRRGTLYPSSHLCWDPLNFDKNEIELLYLPLNFDKNEIELLYLHVALGRRPQGWQNRKGSHTRRRLPQLTSRHTGIEKEAIGAVSAPGVRRQFWSGYHPTQGLLVL
jgi:hypothetical protein